MKVALMGNPNSGKTTLFNMLTKENQKVGNWPGVTIEKKEGKISGEEITVVDLPGVYSLSPYTSEEIVSRDYLLNEKPDVIVNVIDATTIERGLYLTTQLLKVDARIVIALNMIDLCQGRGIEIDAKKLSAKLGCEIVSVSALSGQGVKELVDEIKNKKTQTRLNDIGFFDKIIENELKNIEKYIKSQNKKFRAVELLEGDSEFLKNDEIFRLRNIVENIYGESTQQVIAAQRYRFIESIKKDCVKIKIKKRKITDKIDAILLNKWLAIPIFVLIMSLVYMFSVGSVGKFLSNFVTFHIEKFSVETENHLLIWGAAEWLRSLIVDGVIAGVGCVLSFIPQLAIMFLCLCLLETSGYMSRIAFIFDSIFQKFGLSGKSLVPFIVGSGCSVPAIMSCKTIECESEKQMTAVLTPFIPCSAKLPIIALFSGYFFPNNSGIISVSLYLLAIVVILLSAIILKRFVFKVKETSFLLELPDYKLPKIKNVFKDVFEKVCGFVGRAGSTIFFSSIVVWFLSSFGWNFKYGVSVDKSMLAGIGNLFGWFFYPIVGEWNWAVSVSAIQGLVAKEQVVSSMSVIAGVSGAGDGLFSSMLFSGFSKISAYAFVVFNLFSAPCFGAIGAMKGELKSKKLLFIAILYQIVLAWGISSLIFGVGRMIGL